jgi:hypothetical protein
MPFQHESNFENRRANYCVTYKCIFVIFLYCLVTDLCYELLENRKINAPIIDRKSINGQQHVNGLQLN